MESKVLQQRIEYTLQWLLQSMAVMGYHGSSAGYHLLRGWMPAYPETSGYLIPTLLRAADLLSDRQYLTAAEGLGQWLCAIQMANGAFPGGVMPGERPYIFDTGQILLGLVALDSQKPDPQIRTAIKSAYKWLEKAMSDQTAWTQNSYVRGYIPAYHTRVLWAMAEAGRHLGLDNKVWIEARLLVLTRDLEGDWFTNWAFTPDTPAFTHTIAYTIRGLLECGSHIQDARYLHLADQILERISHEYVKRKKLAGAYSEGWEGDYSFKCVTGHCQLALCFGTRYQDNKMPQYREMTYALCRDIINAQSRIPLKQLRGAIPGSIPVWGKYHRWEYPNWAAKFYIDLLLLAFSHPELLSGDLE